MVSEEIFGQSEENSGQKCFVLRYLFLCLVNEEKYRIKAHKVDRMISYFL